MFNIYKNGIFLWRTYSSVKSLKHEAKVYKKAQILLVSKLNHVYLYMNDPMKYWNNVSNYILTLRIDLEYTSPNSLLFVFNAVMSSTGWLHESNPVYQNISLIR